jgi:hypothetical protein
VSRDDQTDSRGRWEVGDFINFTPTSEAEQLSLNGHLRTSMPVGPGPLPDYGLHIGGDPDDMMDSPSDMADSESEPPGD